ncbi:MAG: ATP-binding cassette domain-containing protein [Lentisphaeraceae bacterium]|nr:ATP-binding cassette domain-containing protein [Lentisphaeraceae bacterium]
MAKATKPLLSAKNLTVKFGQNTALNQVNWQIKEGVNQVLIGPNGSGKSLLANFLTGKFTLHNNQPEVSPKFKPQQDIAFISFELQKELYSIDDYNDDTDFLDYQDIGSTAKEVILNGHKETKTFVEISINLNISYLLDRGIRFLSTGEMRKVLIARALYAKPKLIVIDSPFEGLDQKSRTLLRQQLQIILAGYQCLLLLNEDDPIIDQFDEVTCIDQGKIILEDSPHEIRHSNLWPELFPLNKPITSIPTHHHQYPPASFKAGETIISMKEVSVSYSSAMILDKVNWQVKQGENWLISGPNGAGKSTLLSLVTADNPQGYNQNFSLFGRKRGSGETIWDIKRQIGIVTSQLQQSYKVPLKAVEVVLSGFYDSIGLYQNVDQSMVDLANQWLDLLEIENVRKLYFSEMSYGQQRMVLLARAMIKHPSILILDEPCQGLDKKNREAILNLIDFIAQNCNTSILYVSHSHSEALECITNELEFVQNTDRDFSVNISKRK